MIKTNASVTFVWIRLSTPTSIAQLAAGPREPTNFSSSAWHGESTTWGSSGEAWPLGLLGGLGKASLVPALPDELPHRERITVWIESTHLYALTSVHSPL